ncbi:MAG: 2-oxo acid dehydrogenase subunit E2 [Acidobacteria bacterium]|nr:2-oxo acid dehydrogenase subunit E2 [Acidobacteriota bacterium]
MPAAGRRRQAAVRLSPVVRRLAGEHNVDPTAIKGTGAGGRVTKEDVLRYVESRSAAAGRVEAMSTMRRKIAERMVASRRTSAHVHTVFEVDFSRVATLREAHKAEYAAAGAKLTYLSFVAKAVVDALAEVPVANASLDGDNIVYSDDVGLGIAVALDDGLIVPVVKHAREAGVHELSRAIADLAERARTRRLAPHEVEGGTFTITNHGAFGSLLGMPIINRPQLAILGMGAVEPRPVVVDGAVTVGLRAYLTLGFDHRVIDGATADRFMAAVKRNIEQFDAGLL